VTGFTSTWMVDFEFITRDGSGERPIPVCVTAAESHSGRVLQFWSEDLVRPPYPLDASALYVCYWARAELSCHAALGWPMPCRILDLGVEFRRLTNGLGKLPNGRGLLGALLWYGLDAMNAVEKHDLRALIQRGGPWTRAERRAILDYNKRDVDALIGLYPKMLPDIVRRPGDLERALLRGQSGATNAVMEHHGIPVDTASLRRIQRHWRPLQSRLVDAINPAFGVYEGLTFKTNRFVDYVTRHRIPWPLTEKGHLSLEREVFKDRAKAYPELYPLYELRHVLGQLRLWSLAVGSDGRNRTPLWNLAVKTGRNQPSTSEYIFGPSRWIRHLIKPAPGWAVAYIDWKTQELGIAAALSGDERLLEAVRSGEPYLAFGISAGLAPEGATKATHGTIRDLCKACVLGTGYGLGAASLAFQIGCSRYDALDLLLRHRATYPTFWRWSDANVEYAMQRNKLESVFGWHLHVTASTRITSFRTGPCRPTAARC
jgi:DNA polymerase-1